jgi:hypothetical protein
MKHPDYQRRVQCKSEGRAGPFAIFHCRAAEHEKELFKEDDVIENKFPGTSQRVPHDV